MKQTNFWMAILLLGMGYIIGFTLGTNVKSNSNQELEEITNTSLECLDIAEELMSKHEIWDRDGSDLMVEYFDKTSKLDSLLR